MTDQRDPRRRGEPPPMGRPGAQRFGPSPPATRPEGQHRDQGFAGPAYDPDHAGPVYRGADPGHRAGRGGYPAYEQSSDRSSGHEPELLTHEETSRGVGAVGARRAMPTRVDASPYAEPERRSPGGGLPPLPPVGGRGGDGSGPPRRRGRHPIRKLVLWLIALGLFAPILAFAIGWFIVPVPPPEQIAVGQVGTVLYVNGEVLATVRPQGTLNRAIIGLDQVPSWVRNAVLSAEDRSFYSNPGFDPIGIIRAAWNQLHGVNGGGSTITQQYIKITTQNDQHTLWRKYKEVIEAAKISRVYGKDQILANYLNTIYLGRHAYGIEAAAKAYFGVDAKDLTVAQGALLAAVIQSPSRWDPQINPGKARERWNYVLDGMVSQGYLLKADRDVEQFPTTVITQAISGGIPGDHLKHIYDQVRAELVSDGISEQQINSQGLKITTTIDPNLEKQAASVANKVLKSQPKNLRGSLVSIDPRSGAILAYWGGENGVGLDYAQVFKQPGSSFKPFVMAAALQHDPPIGLGTEYQGRSPMTIAGQTVANSDGDSCDQCDLKTAMTKSINTVFYQLAVGVGPQAVVQVAHDAGIPSDLLPNPTAGIALGDKEVHPQDMASAYATFANGGLSMKPHLISQVETSDGAVLFDWATSASATGNQAFTQQVARNVTESMLNVASGSLIPLAGGRPVAAKTGTTQNRIPGQNNDAWTVGYVPTLSTAVWVGTDDNSPIKNSAGRPIYGRMVAGDIWQQFMNIALRNVPIQDFGQFDPIGKASWNDSGGDSSDSDDPDSDDQGGHHHHHRHHGDDGQQPCEFTQCDDNDNPESGDGDRGNNRDNDNNRDDGNNGDDGNN